MPSLEGPKAKLDRAHEHLTTLNEAVAAFLRNKPYGLRHEVDAKNGDDVWRLEVRHLPPLRLSIIAGDVIHNLRSCLDNLVWQLGLVRTDTPNERGEFPIYLYEFRSSDIATKKEFEGFNKRGWNKVCDVPIVAKQIIESIQPYHGGDRGVGGWLWTLQTISNTDKHRLPLHAGIRQHSSNFPFHFVDFIDASFGPRNDGDEVFRLRRTGRDFDIEEKDKVRTRAGFSVAIDIPSPAGAWPITDVLSDIHQTISDDLLPRFERFFVCCGPGF